MVLVVQPKIAAKGGALKKKKLNPTCKENLYEMEKWGDDVASMEGREATSPRAIGKLTEHVGVLHQDNELLKLELPGH